MMYNMYQMQFITKYCVLIDRGMETEYKLKEGITLDDIPSDDLEQLREYDETNLLLYGKHMLIEFA